MTTARTARRIATIVAASTAAVLALAGCTGTAEGSDDQVQVALIIKSAANPFFLAMEAGAEEAAADLDVDLSVTAGRDLVDEDTQIQAIENAISAGADGILITPNGPSVVDAIQRARDAGVYVIALDDPPNPRDAVDITFATDNRLAGELIGEWAAAHLGGEDAVIATINLNSDTNASVDFERNQGFLAGFGIDVADEDVIGDEARSGSYTGGDGGSYEIVCYEDSDGAEDGGRTAMENCLAQNDDINVVYTINEPAAAGAYEALRALGRTDDVTFVSVDGGCAGVGLVGDGVISATSQQYPLMMAQLGVEAIYSLATTGEVPETSSGLDFYNTGVELVTDEPIDGIESLTSDEGAEVCWG